MTLSNPSSLNDRRRLHALRLRTLVSMVCALATSQWSLAARLTTGPDYPPLSDQSKADGGIATRIVLAVFQGMGEPTSLDWLPWKRGYEDTKAGRYQATFPYVRSSERELHFVYSDAVYTNLSYLWKRSADPLNTQDPTSFAGGKVICVPLGYHSPIEDVLRDQIASGSVRVERPVTRDSCLLMLASKRVDATAGSDSEMGPRITALGLSTQIDRARKPIAELQYFLIAPKIDPTSAALVSRFNAELNRMRADGRYKRLLSD